MVEKISQCHEKLQLEFCLERASAEHPRCIVRLALQITLEASTALEASTILDISLRAYFEFVCSEASSTLAVKLYTRNGASEYTRFAASTLVSLRAHSGAHSEAHSEEKTCCYNSSSTRMRHMYMYMHSMTSAQVCSHVYSWGSVFTAPGACVSRRVPSWAVPPNIAPAHGVTSIRVRSHTGSGLGQSWVRVGIGSRAKEMPHRGSRAKDTGQAVSGLGLV